MSDQEGNRRILLNISTRNTNVAIQFGIAAIVLLLPFVWTPITGKPVDLPIAPWTFAVAAAICLVMTVLAARPKTILITNDNIVYEEKGKKRFVLPWHDVKEVANDVRMYPLRRADNIKLYAVDGKEFELEAAKISKRVMRDVYRVIATDVAVQHPSMVLRDNAGWMSTN